MELGADSLGHGLVRGGLAEDDGTTEGYIAPRRELEDGAGNRLSAPACGRPCVMWAAGDIDVAEELAHARERGVDILESRLRACELRPPGVKEDLPTLVTIAREHIAP